MKYPWFKSLHNTKLFSKNIIQSVTNKKMTMSYKSYELENKIKKILNVKYVVLTTSGTSALMMATIASEIKSGDIVAAPNLTWVATTNPARIMGGRFILADTKKYSQQIDFTDLNKKIKKHKPKLVYLVHLNGKPAYNKKFDELKKKYKFFVIEDAAQAFLSKRNNSSACGTKYDVGCFSLSITKPIHMIYGGFCTTNSKKTADKLISIRNNGVNAKPENARLEIASTMGLNLKPSDVHSAVGLENLRNINLHKNNLRKLHNFYAKYLKSKKIKFINLKGKGVTPCYNEAIIDNRDNFIKFCNENSIGLHLGIRCLSETNIKHIKDNFQNSIYLSKNLVRLPSGPGYKTSEIKKIIKILNKY